MKLVTFASRKDIHIGAIISQGAASHILDLNRAQPDLPTDMTQLLAAGEAALASAKRALARPDAHALVPQADVTLLAPVPRPGKIVCVGHNYVDHAGTKAEEYPTFFAKFTNVLIGHNQPIRYPRFPIHLDWEAELAVVIGKRAKDVAEAHALDVVAGYTIFNDVTARDYQPNSSQWTMRKSFDTFGPMGPALVTPDEIPDPGNLDLALTLNGVEMQGSNTRNLIFSIPFLISYLTRSMTLEPGDVISTGTPSGSGNSRNPPIFMNPGDTVCIRIEKIGELANPIVAE